MRKINCKEILYKTYLFKDTENVLDSVTLSEPVTFKKGEIIYDENRFLKGIGIVLSGEARAVSLNGDVPLSYFGQGKVFGAAAIFGDNKEYISRIEAVSDCAVQFIEQETLTKLFRADEQIAVNYISFLSSKIRFLNGKLSVMMQEGVDGKLYAYLNKLGDEGYSGKMTELSKILCIGRTSLYRSLENLEQNNLIVRKDGKIKVIL